MDKTTRTVVRLLRPSVFLSVLLTVWWTSNAARANANLYFQGGTMKNYVVDLIFWGSNFSPQDRADVRDYVTNFTQYLDGQDNQAGKDPAVRYYGMWGILPGAMISDIGPAPSGLNDGNAVPEVHAARNGALGSATDFSGNWIGNALPTGQNRLPIVVVKGLTKASVSDSNCENLVSHPCVNIDGFHDSDSGGFPYAAVLFNDGLNSNGGLNIVFPSVIAHEVQEAMTDPYTFGNQGWVTQEGLFGLTHEEACDSCEFSDNTLSWMASSGDNISGINDVTLDPSYGGFNNIAADTCQLWEPEQYAPIAATMEFGAVGVVVYRTPSGHINALNWSSDRAAPSGPFDYGQPAPNVTAQGKPAIIYGFSTPGEIVFVRGSDNALWMLKNGVWTSLGGLFYGDPSAVIWNGNVNQNVFVLGTDDTLWTQGLVNAVPQGWGPVPNNIGRVFSGPPKAFSKSPSTIDVFAVGENGHLEWLPFSQSSGWSVLTDLGTMLGHPHHTPVSITSWASNRLDIFATSESAVAHRGWNGSWAGDYDSRGNELGTTPSGTPAVVSWGTNRLDAFMIDRQNRLTHTYYDGSWHGDPNNPFRTDAVGDPIMLSRGSGLLEVFYRTTNGSLSHLVFDAGWSTQANVLPANSIQ
jgi:hypothetical protein